MPKWRTNPLTTNALNGNAKPGCKHYCCNRSTRYTRVQRVPACSTSYAHRVHVLSRFWNPSVSWSGVTTAVNSEANRKIHKLSYQIFQVINNWAIEHRSLSYHECNSNIFKHPADKYRLDKNRIGDWVCSLKVELVRQTIELLSIVLSKT